MNPPEVAIVVLISLSALVLMLLGLAFMIAQFLGGMDDDPWDDGEDES